MIDVTDRIQPTLKNIGIPVHKVPMSEDFYGSSYVGQFPCPIGNGRLSEDKPMDVFYQPNPDRTKDHSNYFGLYIKFGKAYVCDASYVKDLEFTGIEGLDGYIHYSTYQHDYRQVDSGVAIDGGPCAYFRIIGDLSRKRHSLFILDGRIMSRDEEK